MLTPSDLANVLTLLFGFILLLKKFAEMERYHRLRAFVLTSILICIMIYFFTLTVGNTGTYCCEPGCFTLSEY